VHTALLVAGKPADRRQQLNSLRAVGILIYINDELSRKPFMVDMKASCSVLPFSSSSLLTGPKLTGADGNDIPTLGVRRLSLQFGQQRFVFPFILAAVDKNIIGVDFLAHFKLLVDPSRRLVLDAASLKPVSTAENSATTSSPSIVATLSSVQPVVRQLLAEFPAVLAADLAQPAPLHQVQHQIITSG
jgi:hypothetical protein